MPLVFLPVARLISQIAVPRESTAYQDGIILFLPVTFARAGKKADEPAGTFGVLASGVVDVLQKDGEHLKVLLTAKQKREGGREGGNRCKSRCYAAR